MESAASDPKRIGDASADRNEQKQHRAPAMLGACPKPRSRPPRAAAAKMTMPLTDS
jgi:hypothetical protein